MITDTAHERATTSSKPRLSRFIFIATCVGIGLDVLIAWLWPGLRITVFLAMWIAGFAITVLVMSVSHQRRCRQPLWGTVIAGQILGVIAIGLFFLLSLA